MARRKEVHQLDGVRRAVASLESAIGKMTHELEALSNRDDTEWVQATPALQAINERLGISWGPLSMLLRSVISGNEARHRIDADSYFARLGKAFKEQNWEVSGDATRPLIEGLVFVEIDIAKPEIRINSKLVKDMAPASVTATVADTLSRIKARRTTPETFLTELEHAYDEESRAMGVQPGSQVHLSALHQRLLLARQSKAFLRDPRSETFKEYPLELIRADLYGALAADSPTPSGRRLRVASGSDTQGAVFMLVPMLGRAGYVGRVWFER